MAANTTPNIGQECKLYYNSAGDFDDAVSSADWVEMSDVQDLTLGDESDKAEANTRASRVKRYLLGLTDHPVSFSSLWDPSDTGFAVFLAARVAKTKLPVMILDGSKSDAGSTGFKADMFVAKCERQEVLGEATKADIELCVAYSANLPTVVTVGT
jgi:hypothetical protein